MLNNHFLAQVAREILSHSDGIDLSQTLVVLPSRRAATFFKRYLSQQAARAIWAPRLVTIDELMCEVAQMKAIDPVHLQLQLFKLHCQRAKNPDPLEYFLSWAPVFLTDVNELDLHLADTHQALKDMADIKRLEQWDVSGRPPSALQRTYLERLREQADLYVHLRNLCENQGRAWSGLIYRKAAEQSNFGVLQAQVVWAVGLNALSPAEKNVLKKLAERGTLHTRWDADQHYLDNPEHEAGMHLRQVAHEKYLHQNGPMLHVADHFNQIPKKIEVLACANAVTMARMAGNLVHDILEADNQIDRANIAVVLADKALLMPVLHAMPPSVDALNVTMGFPFRSSPWFGWVSALAEMHLQAQRSQRGFYHAHLAQVFGHHVGYLLFSDANKLVASVASLGRPYLSHKNILSLVNGKDAEVMGKLLHPWNSANQLANAIIELTTLIVANLTRMADSGGVDTEFALLLNRAAAQFKQAMAEWPEIDLKGAVGLFLSSLRPIEVPFEGEPLQGVQVMGLLETRALDFEHLIILSVNEGVLPPDSNRPSDLSPDLRQAFGLPQRDSHEAIVAYNFYRLLHRAKQVSLLYSAQSSGLSGGEESRYIRQMEAEMPATVNIVRKSVATPSILLSVDTDLFANPSAHASAQLASMAQRGFSPSALNTFRECGFKFYMNYVCGISEPDQIDEHLGHAHVGNAVHKALEQVYKPFEGQWLKPADIDTMRQSLDAAVSLALAEQLNGRELLGRDLLAERAVLKYAQRALDNDANRLSEATEIGLQLRIVSLETPISAALTNVTQPSGGPVLIKGTLDRLDQYSNGIVCVIDHKTGGADPQQVRALTVKDHLAFSNFQKKSRIPFQLMAYAWLASKSNQSAASAQVNFLRSNNLAVPLRLGDEATWTGQTLEEWMEVVAHPVVDAIFNPDQKFAQTTNQKSCEYCHLKAFCGR